jgi:LmbE family N-acetylglucosaminyl deacetylase
MMDGMPRHTSTSAAVIALGSACAMLAASAGGVALAQAPRTLLAVFAHPDDEQVVAPLLARYAREGVRVVLAIATDGQKGVRAHAGIAAGEPLATARAAEARCACERLGIPPPVLMEIEDGALHAGPNATAAREHIVRLMAELTPQAVVTWGPDGVTGHTDHRMIGNLVTEVVQRGGKGVPSRLYYVGLPAERLAALPPPSASAGAGVPRDLAVVAERYLPVRIAYSEADARKAAESLACHKSQYTPEELVTMTRLTRTLEDGAVRLRPWFGEPRAATDLFE